MRNAIPKRSARKLAAQTGINELDERTKINSKAAVKPRLANGKARTAKEGKPNNISEGYTVVNVALQTLAEAAKSTGPKPSAKAIQAAKNADRTLEHMLRLSHSTGCEDLVNTELYEVLLSFASLLIVLQLQNQAMIQLARIYHLLSNRTQNSYVKQPTKGYSPAQSTEYLQSNGPSPAHMLNFHELEPHWGSVELLIHHQLLVMRLLVISPPSIVQEAFKHVQLSARTSLANLILRAAEGGRSVSKTVKDLELLAQCLVKCCPKLSKDDDQRAVDAAVSISPELSLQYQTLAFQVRFLQSKIGLDATSNVSAIYESFSRCVVTFMRRTTASAKESYDVIARCFADLRSSRKEIEAVESSSNSRPIPEEEHTMYQLSHLAQSAGLDDEASLWANERLSLINPNSTPREQLIAKLRAASSKLATTFTLDNLESLTASISTVVESLGIVSDFREPFSETRELLTFTSQVVSYLKFVLRVISSMSPLKPAEVIMCCRNALVSSITYLSRALEQPSEPVLEPFVDALCKISPSIVNAIIVSCTIPSQFARIDWTTLAAAMEVCRKYVFLILHMFKAKCDESYILDEFHKLLVKISDTYWAFFVQKTKEKSIKLEHEIACLQRCCEILRSEFLTTIDLPGAPTKLYKFGQKLRQARRDIEAHQIFHDALSVALDEDSLRDIGSKICAESVELISKGNAALGLLVKIVNEITDIELHAAVPIEKTCFDSIQRLGPQHHGFLREIQLRFAKSLSAANEFCTIKLKYLKQMLEILLSIYNDAEYPIRRRRVLVKALIVFLQHDRISTGKLVELAQAHKTNHIRADNSFDIRLLQYSDYLLVTLEVLIAVGTGLTDENLLKTALLSWKSMLSQCRTIDDLRHMVDDLDDCFLLLERIASFCCATGFFKCQILCLQMSLQLKQISPHRSTPTDVDILTDIAAAFISLGQSNLAKDALDRVISRAQNNDVLMNSDIGSLDLVHLDCILAQGSYDKAWCKWPLLRKLAQSGLDILYPKGISPVVVKSEDIVLAAIALRSFSRVLKFQGSVAESLYAARASVDLLRAALKKYDFLVKDVVSEDEQPEHDSGSRRWAASPFSPEIMKSTRIRNHLLSGMLWVSELLQDAGIEQDAQNQLVQAEKLVEFPCYEQFVRQLALRHADLHRRCERLQDANTFVKRAAALETTNLHVTSIENYIALGQLRHDEKKWSPAVDAYHRSKAVLKTLMSDEVFRIAQDGACESSGILQAQQNENSTVCRRIKPKSSSKLPGDIRAKRCLLTKVNQQMHAHTSDSAPELEAIEINIWRLEAETLLAQNQTLDNFTPGKANCDTEINVLQHITLAKAKIQSALQSMQHEGALSVLSESVLAVPATAPISARKERVELGSGESNLSEMVQSLENMQIESTGKPKAQVFQAMRMLLDAQKFAYQSCSSSTIASLTSCLFKSVILLSNLTCHNTARVHPNVASHTSCISQFTLSARERAVTDSESWRRRGRKIVLPRDVSSISPPDFTLSSSNLQPELVDTMPEGWTVISIMLEEDMNHVSLVKLQAKQSPFTLRLPLLRQNADDPEDESFSFVDARDEMLEIIRSSDTTVHILRDDPDLAASKQGKSDWWAKRQALDRRLHDLLLNIENLWFGGFRGIFSHTSSQSAPLARFEKTLENILDRHLPSRQRNSRNKQVTRISLSTGVISLFASLPINAEDCDLDEALMDLMYFVVDVLQFNGEQNAYDEIDFDAMVVEIHDALQSYHEFETTEYSREVLHTILVLDRRLHVFPWESLPCLQGQSVSRVMSLADIRERVSAMRRQHMTETSRHEEHNSTGALSVSRLNGMFILNPAGDLTKTQMRFEHRLTHLNDWTGIIAREPEEREILNALNMTLQDYENGKVFMYFGHGSGAQYIRQKQIRLLRCQEESDLAPKTESKLTLRQHVTCAVALLFGCSSVSLTQAGEFEPHGTPRSYLVGGSPAVLGSLWDVTDGDLDRFASGVLERWGLLQPSGAGFETTKEKNAKGKTPATKASKATVSGLIQKSMSLTDAVTQSRGDCYLRYLNGAAMVVYGVPVLLCE